MMKRITYLFLSAAILLASCTNTSEGELLKDNTRAGIEKELSYSDAHADKRIAITGYLNFMDGASYDVGKEEITMSFTLQPNDEGESLNSFKVKMGDGKNEVQIPKGTGSKTVAYNTTESTIDPSKITLKTNSGQVVPLTQKLKISGTVKYTKDFSTGKTMETPMFNSDKKGFVYELEDIRFDEIK